MSKNNLQDTWDLTHIYNDVSELKADVKKLLELLNEFLKLKGKLNNKETLIKEVLLGEQTGLLESKIYSYLSLRSALNIKDDEIQHLSTEIYIETDKINKQLNFVVPEILANDEKLLLEVANDERIRPRRKSYLKFIESKKHWLSEREEYIFDRLLSGSSISSIYDLHQNELTFEKALDSNNVYHEVTHTNLSKLFESPDRTLRKNTFKSVYKTYSKHIYTIGEMYLSYTKTRKEINELRKYNSVLEAVVIADESTEKVYNTLITTVNENLNVVDNIIKLLKKVTNLQDFNRYDFGYNPYKAIDQKYTYIEAQEIVKKALSVLGEEYISKLDKAFNSRWIDVYPKENKDKGAFNLGVYNIHPYVLLNFEGTFDDVSTIAHELGHAMHSCLAMDNQKLCNSGCTIMVAEVASTVNEILLTEYLLNNETDIEKKKYILLEQILTIHGTLLRQTMFAEFEKQVADKMQNDEVLTTKILNEIYLDLTKKYFRAIIELDTDIKYEWARIPHFYSTFYVYKYATGISSAIAIAQNILKKGKPYIDKYFDMLKSGTSVDSISTLKIAEVDLEDKNTYISAIEFLNNRIEQLNDLIDNH